MPSCLLFFLFLKNKAQEKKNILLLIEMPDQFPGPARSNGPRAGAWLRHGQRKEQKLGKKT